VARVRAGFAEQLIKRVHGQVPEFSITKIANSARAGAAQSFDWRKAARHAIMGKYKGFIQTPG
jgi:hypothetical protein